MVREAFGLITRQTNKLLKPNSTYLAFGFVQSKLDIDKKALTEVLRFLKANVTDTKIAINFPQTDLECIIMHSKRCYAAFRPDTDHHSNKIFVTIENYEPYNDNLSLLPSPNQYTIEAMNVDELYHGFIRIHNILTSNDAAVKARVELDDVINTVTRDDDVPVSVLKKGFV